MYIYSVVFGFTTFDNVCMMGGQFDAQCALLCLVYWGDRALSTPPAFNISDVMRRCYLHFRIYLSFAIWATQSVSSLQVRQTYNAVRYE